MLYDVHVMFYAVCFIVCKVNTHYSIIHYSYSILHVYSNIVRVEYYYIRSFGILVSNQRMFRQSCRLSIKRVIILTGLNGLTSLCLSTCPAATDTLIHSILIHCKTLTSLSLYECPNITKDSIVTLLTQASALTRLDVNKCTGVTGVVVPAESEGVTGVVPAESEEGPETFFGTGTGRPITRSSEYKRVQVRMNDITRVI